MSRRRLMPRTKRWLILNTWSVRLRELKRPPCLSLGRPRLLKTSTLATSCLVSRPSGKQAVQRFPGLDFSALQPYDDVDSVADASQDQAGDEDVSSK
jgi:hypothetical protein